MDSSQGFKCSTASKESMLWTISLHQAAPRKTGQEIGCPGDGTKVHEGQLAKEFLPVNRIKAKLRNRPHLSNYQLTITKVKIAIRGPPLTLWFIFFHFLNGSVWCNYPVPSHHCTWNMHMRNRNLVFLVHNVAATRLLISSLGERLCSAQRYRILLLMQWPEDIIRRLEYYIIL